MVAEPSELTQATLSSVAAPRENELNGQTLLDETTPLERQTNVRRLPVEYGLVKLEGEYEGWWARVRTNPRQSTIVKLSAGETTYDGLHELLKEHNFVDEEGAQIPLTREGTDMIPPDLGLLVVNKWAEIRKLPKTTDAA